MCIETLHSVVPTYLMCYQLRMFTPSSSTYVTSTEVPWRVSDYKYALVGRAIRWVGPLGGISLRLCSSDAAFSLCR